MNEVLKQLENKILLLEGRMLRLRSEDKDWDGVFNMIQKLKECKEVLEILEEIK